MLLKVAPYDTELEMDPMVYAIRSIKQHPRGRAVECLAAEMVDILHKKLIVLDKKTPFSHTVIAHIPRSGKKVSRYGFDQARLLAKAVSKGTGIPFSPLLKRKKNTREQKTLTQRGRQENLRGAFFAKSDLRGARVILVDDVVTTGAGMAECTRVLRRSGAGQIVCLCAAMTPKRRREDDLHRYHTREST